MSDKSSRIGVALVKELCPVCAKEIDGPIIMNSRIGPKIAEKVEAMHGKIIGYSKKPCEECSENMKVAFMLVVCDLSKTTDKNNPYRTNQIFGIKKEAVERLLGDNKKTLDAGVAFIGIEEAKQIGLPVE